ncbi:YabP/YqfC family sporulation protein [Brevibacillus brevis]|uniref:YabP/YqfC family sporulation protein n=1 Tax=Brevibacillus brevis TaxID=1393 RepID=UPI0009EF1689|nr:YabP/YqfC family sporulation protein [Brevibacillus brevis]
MSNKHELIMVNRNKVQVSGVKDIVSLDDTSITLETTNGFLEVSGEKLKVTNLNLETGEVSIIGEVVEIKYLT